MWFIPKLVILFTTKTTRCSICDLSIRKGETEMTTQTEITGTSPVQDTKAGKKINWQLISIMSGFTVIVIVFMGLLPTFTAAVEIQPGMAASAARYQGLAESFAAQDAALSRGWGATVLRYQGLADLFTLPNASAARYQGLADFFAAQEVAAARGWEATAARYQGLADFYLASD
jgi:hypothetical protein